MIKNKKKDNIIFQALLDEQFLSQLSLLRLKS